jgi:small-conductance mechanosensitive channel
MQINEESRVISQITISKLFFAIVVVTLAWLLLKWMTRFFQRIETHSPRLRFLANQLQPPIRIFVWFSALMLVVDIIAPTRDAFLAVLGSAALAIGLGLQDLIKNLVGGLVIVADVPFQTGDRVEIGHAHGEVVHIGLRSTKLLTPDGKIAAIPNSEILTQQTFNSNRSVPEAMVTTDVNVPRGLDPSVVLHLGREVAICSPYTHLGRPVTVDLEDNDTRHVVMKLSIEAYVYDHRFEPAMRTDILRRAQREFKLLTPVPPPEHHAHPGSV